MTFRRSTPIGFRDCQIAAIQNLEESFKADRPRALIQMATGSGKTFTAITSVYRLLKHADAKRILFLVDTKNLGEQAEQEFMSYLPERRQPEVHRALQRPAAQFALHCVEQPGLHQHDPADVFHPQGRAARRSRRGGKPGRHWCAREEPLPVVYNKKVPPEFFDFIIIDECHRSIYNLWRQVIEYFDAYLIGLTATPDNRTYGFFKKNVVSEYSHEKAVADGVNVGNEIYVIETEVTRQGAQINAEQQIEKRERLTRKKRWERQDEDEQYSAGQLDRDVVNPDQIRTVIRTFRDKLPEIFPGRSEVPKTLVFAKTDSHADDIIQIVREEFGEGNDFCKKVTYQADEDPKSVLAQFRNDYYPRIAVTVDMIATGTDVKPLECLLFMRDVKSRNYFEQMKGRGTRVLDADDLKKVTPSAIAKTHYVIVDAVGVTKSLKTASQPLITKPTVPLKDLATGVMMGARDEDTVSSLAGRLARLDRELDDNDRARISALADGKRLTDIVSGLLGSIDADRIEEVAIKANKGKEPTEEQRRIARDKLVGQAANVFTGPLINLIDSIRREKEQTIDHDNLDTVLHAGWDGDAKTNAQNLTKDFAAYLEEHRDKIEALTIFFNQPARRCEITYAMIKGVFDALRADRPKLAPVRIWRAYALLDDYNGTDPANELTALVALIRRVCGLDQKIAPYAETVKLNFQTWIMKRHSGAGEKFTGEQLEWLHMIRDHIATSIHIERDDLDMAPFDAKGGLGKMYQLFGENIDGVLHEMNEALAA